MWAFNRENNLVQHNVVIALNPCLIKAAWGSRLAAWGSRLAAWGSRLAAWGTRLASNPKKL